MVFKVSYSLLIQFWILFNVPNSLIVQLGAKVLLNSWIQTNNVQEGTPLISVVSHGNSETESDCRGDTVIHASHSGGNQGEVRLRFSAENPFSLVA